MLWFKMLFPFVSSSFRSEDIRAYMSYDQKWVVLGPRFRGREPPTYSCPISNTAYHQTRGKVCHSVTFMWIKKMLKLSECGSKLYSWYLSHLWARVHLIRFMSTGDRFNIQVWITPILWYYPNCVLN